MTATHERYVDNLGVTVADWIGLANGEAGAATNLSNVSDKTVQVIGTFGASGEVTMQGSPDGTTWGTLNDNQGTAVVITDSTPVLLAENTRYTRPNVTAGDGTTDLDVYIVGAVRT